MGGMGGGTVGGGGVGGMGGMDEGTGGMDEGTDGMGGMGGDEGGRMVSECQEETKYMYTKKVRHPTYCRDTKIIQIMLTNSPEADAREHASVLRCDTDLLQDDDGSWLLFTDEDEAIEFMSCDVPFVKR